MITDYDTIEYDGKTLTLTEQAYMTCRLFPGCFQDTADGETYTVEYAAGAVDEEGNKYRVMWQFETVKGAEPEDDGYDWDNVHAVLADY